MYIVKKFSVLLFVLSVSITPLLSSALISGEGSGLVLHYSFDESAGSTVTDLSGNSNDGFLLNDPVWSGGQVGDSSLSFDGINDSVVAETNPVGTSAISFSAWIQPRSFNGESNRGTIFSNGKTGLRVNGATKALQFSNNGFSTLATSATNVITLDTWQFVVVTRDNDGLVNFYLNGVPSGAAQQSAGATQSATTNFIIGDHLNMRHFDGFMDDFRIYDRVLTASEITELYVYTGENLPPDNIAPVISHIQAGSVTASSAIISWTTDEPADTQIEYGTTTAYGNETVLNSTLTTSHGQMISGLNASTTYQYRVKSKDSTHNFSVSENQQFTTTASPTTGSFLTTPGQTHEWGINITNRQAALGSLSDAILVSANSGWSLALKGDGSLITWGSNGYGQQNAPTGSFIHANAGWRHGIAVREDGSVVEWGLSETAWPGQTPQVTNAVQVAGGDLHSAALLDDGTVLIWGERESMTSWSGVITNAVAISSGWYHMLVLLDDGTVVTFGEATSGQDNTVPAGLSGVVKIATGPFHNLAVKSDGTLVAWGLNNFGQSTPPSTATDIVAVAGGRYHTLALKSDGTIIAWGDNAQGQLNIPNGLTASFISAGYYHSQAIEGVPAVQ